MALGPRYWVVVNAYLPWIFFSLFVILPLPSASAPTYNKSKFKRAGKWGVDLDEQCGLIILSQSLRRKAKALESIENIKLEIAKDMRIRGKFSKFWK